MKKQVVLDEAEWRDLTSRVNAADAMCHERNDFGDECTRLRDKLNREREKVEQVQHELDRVRRILNEVYAERDNAIEEADACGDALREARSTIATLEAALEEVRNVVNRGDN